MILAQILAVTRMNVLSIPRRAGLSIATIGSITMVVAVLLGFLALAEGFAATGNSTGAKDIAFVLRSGSEAELNSTISREQAVILETGPGVVRDESGAPLISPELYVIVDAAKPGSDSSYNIGLRGVGQKAFAIRPKFSIVEGRMLQPGTNEVVVGRALSREFKGMELGNELVYGTTRWRVVGIFDTAGSVFESEVWADLSVVQSLFNRGSSMQTLRLKLTSADALPAFKSFVDNDPRLKLEVQSEYEYYANQTNQLATVIRYFGWPLGVAMAIGALAGAINTMYSSVDGRRREIATLRAIGFNGLSAFIGTMVESLFLAVIGGLLGSLLAYIFVDGLQASAGFNQIVFTFKLTGNVVMQGVSLALVVGLLGGILPAARAARMPITVAYQN